MTERSHQRPARVFDSGLQHERTALAWERTAIASMLAGILMARYAATTVHYAFAAVGLGQVVLGGVVLVWAGTHYDDLHGPLRAGRSPVHPAATRALGLGTLTFTAAAAVLVLVELLS